MKYFSTKEELKFKPMEYERLLISFDRLTRFKNTTEKYLRVFKDILINNLISPKYKKTELEEMDFGELTSVAEKIINTSLENLLPQRIETNFIVNKRLAAYEESLFGVNKETRKLIDNKINYDAFISLLKDDIPLNLKWLKMLADNDYSEAKSHIMGYHFPIKKLVICEGITEEILLPVFADILEYNFDKNGVHIVSAGGKNQVVKLFYTFAESLNLPIFVLLDSDARDNYNEILFRLRKFDKIYMISHGEFEDILPVRLIEKALKYSIANISVSPASPVEEFDDTGSMVEYLENFYKNRGVHEFKKAEFAQIVKKNISGVEDVSAEFKDIIQSIKDLG